MRPEHPDYEPEQRDHNDPPDAGLRSTLLGVITDLSSVPSAWHRVLPNRS
jgi:hypothetical protein